MSQKLFHEWTEGFTKVQKEEWQRTGSIDFRFSGRVLENSLTLIPLLFKEVLETLKPWNPETIQMT